MIEACRSNPIAFVNDWCFTYDPRNADEDLPTTIPFDLLPTQENLIGFVLRKLFEHKNGLIEKSRDEGFTWTMAALAVWLWRFRRGVKIGFGSRKFDLVDELGDLDAILPKVAFLIDHLPRWLRPDGYRARDHRKLGLISNPENGSTISGEGGDDIGRGGRSTMYVLDEVAFLPRAERAEKALSQNTRCIIYGSTVNGLGNLFARKRHGGKTEVFVMDWRNNPLKNRSITKEVEGKPVKVYPWYEEQRAKFAPTVVASEIDRDYVSSVANVVIEHGWIQAAVTINLEELFPKAMYPKEAGLDVAGDSADADLNVYTERHGPNVRRVEAWSGIDEILTARKALGLAMESGCKVLAFDRIGNGAAVAGAYAHNEELAQVPPEIFRVLGINSGHAPTERIYEDDPRTPASGRFINFRAEMWWNIRLRFWRTYRFLTGEITDVDPSLLISIPNDPRLIHDLSLMTYDVAENGKYRIKSKKKLRQEGIKSPDFADSLVYCFSPKPSISHDVLA